MTSRRYVLLEKRDHVAVITMNRPERLNALGREGGAELSAVMQEVETDPDVRVAIITGAGDRAFSVGADLKDRTVHASESMAESLEMFTSWGSGGTRDLKKPLIAAVNGYCIGGGLEQALACDIMICAENAIFQLPQVGLGIFPGFACPYLVRLVGKSWAMEIVLTGRRVDAREALRCGLVNRVVPLAELVPTAVDMAREIAAKPPLGVLMAKQAIKRAMELSLRDALLDCGMRLFPLYGSAERKEASRAFVEKRQPQFQDSTVR